MDDAGRLRSWSAPLLRRFGRWAKAGSGWDLQCRAYLIAPSGIPPSPPPKAPQQWRTSKSWRGFERSSLAFAFMASLSRNDAELKVATVWSALGE